MAVQSTAPSPVGDIQQTAPVSPGITIGKIWRETRRFPVVPSLILIALLVIPALFAPWIAPHDHIIGDLERELEPPAGSTTAKPNWK